MCISIERRKWNQNGHNSQSEQRIFKIIENIARSQLESKVKIIKLPEARENASDQVAIYFLPSTENCFQAKQTQSRIILDVHA